MNITDKNIDSGRAFDWGRTSENYARFRDVYPQEFYDKIVGRNLCVKGQQVLDLGTGAGETMHPIVIQDVYRERFELVYHEEYPLKVHFTRESWHGRMKTCRGIGASLSETEIADWEQEHLQLLAEISPAEFDILHYAAIAELRVVK